ncbi:forkhead box protein K2-like [Pollicipes pollicipes]|uniref:forkhead box protein K2-like n=1 Tax=Pollicipes pollicipes TaxID=41117 RepID=UPI001884E848|nr:forkhead box protein K2-like [Pollicipes pollicipes]
MGHQQEVMASELCDLDTKQTVLVRSSFEDVSNASYREVDCSGIEWQPDYSHCYTPPGHGQALPQLHTVPAGPEPDGDYKRSIECTSSQPLPPSQPSVQQVSRPDGDGSSLMWLLDYRLDHLLEPASDDTCHPAAPPAGRVREEVVQTMPQAQQQAPSCCQGNGRWDHGMEVKCDHDYKAAQEVQQQGYYATSTTKPPFTYTELIEQAMIEEGELTVSGIYRWITSHFAFYKSCDDRWKNSVRHNLSMNPYFRKGEKAKNGTGHLWMLANVEGRRVRRNNVAARMGRPARKQSAGDVELDLCDDIPSPANDIWLSSAADNKENMPISGEYSIEYLNYVPDQAAPPTAFTLEESADRILSGSNNHVEVQFITPVRNERIAQDVMLVDYQQLDVAMQS